MQSWSARIPSRTVGVQAQSSLSISIVHKSPDSHHRHHDYGHDCSYSDGRPSDFFNEVRGVSTAARQSSQQQNAYVGPRIPIRYDIGTPVSPRPLPSYPTLRPAPRPRYPSSRFSSAEISKIVKDAKTLVDERLAHEQKILMGTYQVPALEPDSGHQAKLNPRWALSPATQGGALTTRIRNTSITALLAEEATRLLANTNALNGQAVAHELPLVDIRGTELDRQCSHRFEYPCYPHKYRSYNGHCNNVQNPNWGNSGTRYGRFLAPDYADGISEPRMRSSLAGGGTLPSARNVSLRVHGDADQPHPHVNVMFVALAEFVALDLANTASYAGAAKEPLRCCGVPLELFHPECFPVRVPEGDPTYPHKACLHYIRSTPAVRTGCTLGPREQINQATSFIDASPLYGNSREEAVPLRLFQKGELLADHELHKGGVAPRMASGAPRVCQGQLCFLAGDLRINENAPLASMHALWLREHNRVSRTLASLNPHWRDHVLFEEARRIVIAELQHIVYAELLPAIIGSVEKYRLRPLNSGYSEDYNINLDPSTANEAATAVLHFVISMMPGYLELQDLHNSSRKTQMETLRTFYAPDEVRSHINEFVLGMLTQHAQAKDEYVSAAMTNTYPMNTTSYQVGLDDVSILIQQGRDHGIPGYTAFRRFCGLDLQLHQFKDFTSITTPETAKNLASLYSSVDDVDLFVGGMVETPLEGAVVGPTFACLLGLQFQKSKQGDRFYYENDLPPSKFSKEQLAQIRRVSLARLICDNTVASERDAIKLQPASLFMPDPFLNAEEACSSPGLERVDFSAWKSLRSADFTDQFSRDQLKLQLSIAREELDNLRREEIRLQKRQGSPDQASSQAVLSALLRPSEDALRLANESLLLELASKGIVFNYLHTLASDRDGEREADSMQDLLAMLATVGLPEDLRPTRTPGHCDDTVLPCDHTTKFRTMTGWCNNLRYPFFGKSLTPFARLAPAKYSDGVSEMATIGTTGQPLPNPRAVSTAIHYDIADAHRRYTLMLMQWGQFLDHDITLTPMVEYPDKSNINCKRCDSATTVHPECRPIKIPPGDRHFPARQPDGSNNCISFVRSLPGQQNLGARQQLNQVTAFIDASAVYGSNRCEMRRLRSYRGGRLNVTNIGIGLKPLPPQTATHKECRAPSRLCFTAGDDRVSEQPGLAVIHTMLLREHNRVVEKLSRVNPHWEDERLFQEGRRIVSAEMQQITYGEFLPRVLGRATMDHYELNLASNGYSRAYNPEVDPSVWNEFSTAAFRFGHTLIAPFFRLLGNEYDEQRPEALQLRKGFFNSDMLYRPGAIDSMLRGLVSVSMRNFDSAVTEEVTNHLFEERRKPFSGMDLIALNLQRARDHGLSGYNEYRHKCNLNRATSFEDLVEIPEAVRHRLALIYAHVDDIDLFTGGLAERSLHGAVVGPTFACLIGAQFSKMKRGDRFFFETDDPAVRFSEAQLAGLRGVTLSRLLCDNSDRITTVQKNAFDQIDDFLNPRVACSTLPSLDLKLWRDGESCSVQAKNIPRGQSLTVSPCRSCTCTAEGVYCTPVRISDCFALLKTQHNSEIFEDAACRVQCAFAMVITDSRRATRPIERHPSQQASRSESEETDRF
ncbi:uncharacterized protein LOC111262832 isoform X1 [Varroa jacobsoni]|uniref:uncharacterized protein LOC111262832 isoform X1 n=1 Tax=Varroa jacobsoni TaxID=62625 RepID=UPI000BF7FC87|nr:uncharacterized protein LOC111262832 isoform X1 [Varroa jacobsoni]